MTSSPRLFSALARLGAVSALVVLVSLALPGCGGGGKGSVRGKVVYKGAPVTGGNVTLSSATGTFPLFLKEDGTITSSDVPPGDYKVAIQTFQAAAPPQMPGVAPPPVPGNLSKATPIPAKYANPETSGLTWNITKGSNPEKVFELTGDLP